MTGFWKISSKEKHFFQGVISFSSLCRRRTLLGIVVKDSDDVLEKAATCTECAERFKRLNEAQKKAKVN